MTEQETATDKDWHRKFAIDLFNQVWDLMDKEDRTQEDNDRMLHAAHASRYHWGETGTPLELERGEWQISRVYSVLNRPEAALNHAGRCLEICEANSIEDFDLAFAHEALARAHAVAGALDKSREHIRLAEQAGEKIEEKDNRDYFFSELKAVSDMLS